MKYKLIKQYPYSDHLLGDIVNNDNREPYGNFPEFWEETKEPKDEKRYNPYKDLKQIADALEQIKNILVEKLK